jgi:hypothetical protein
MTVRTAVKLSLDRNCAPVAEAVMIMIQDKPELRIWHCLDEIVWLFLAHSTLEVVLMLDV